jgi:Zn-finger nucleic acid-binding protein
MQCPVCGQDQIIVEWKGVELDLCIDRHGIWFDGQELGQLFEVAGAPAVFHDLEDLLEELPRGQGGPVRRCPRCRVKMRQVRAPGAAEEIILDRCPHGHGIWFDDGELEEMVELQITGDEEALRRVRAFLLDFFGEKKIRRALADETEE